MTAMSQHACTVVMKLGTLYGLLATCTEEDLEQLSTWAQRAFPEDYKGIAQVIQDEQSRRISRSCGRSRAPQLLPGLPGRDGETTAPSHFQP